MKCASTTLHGDLEQHPDIFCGKKELDAITEPGRYSVEDIYRRNFSGAKPDQLLGDVSTSYSMLPQYPGVPSKAKQFSSDLKIIYIVREPLSRTLSHHKHMTNWSGAGRMGPDINDAIKHHPELIHYSCYAMQLQPWIDAFGMERVLVVRFEDYVSQRKATVDRVIKFLGLPVRDLQLEESGANRSQDRRYAGKLTLWIYRSFFFQRLVQPLTPTGLKGFLRLLLLKKSKSTLIPPTAETVDFVIDSVREDVSKLQTMLSLKEPMWDLDTARQKQLEWSAS